MRKCDKPSALALLESRPADLVILDWMLPGLDGLEVCRRIRARSITPILLILATGIPILAAIGEMETARAEAVEALRSRRMLVANISHELRTPLAQAEGRITLAVQAPPGLPRACADQDRLRQILANLVRNAVRHACDGGIIVLSVGQEDDRLVLAVADTGEGIPAEHLPHLFDRFYRAGETQSASGAGLGLAIVPELVELMGGRVSVQSEVGEGSCFRVYLPRASTPRPSEQHP